MRGHVRRGALAAVRFPSPPLPPLSAVRAFSRTNRDPVASGRSRPPGVLGASRAFVLAVQAVLAAVLLQRQAESPYYRASARLP